MLGNIWCLKGVLWKNHEELNLFILNCFNLEILFVCKMKIIKLRVKIKIKMASLFVNICAMWNWWWCKGLQIPSEWSGINFLRLEQFYDGSNPMFIEQSTTDKILIVYDFCIYIFQKKKNIILVFILYILIYFIFVDIWML